MREVKLIVHETSQGKLKSEDVFAVVFLSNAVEGATLGAVAGRFGGKGTATKHVTNSFHRVLRNKNWSYYFTQINTQAVRDGLAAIPGILRATIPTVSKSFLKFATQR